MTAVRDWLAGKKTYIMAGALVSLGLFFIIDQDATNDDMGISFIVVALGMMGLHAQADRHHAEQIAAVAQALKSMAQRKPLTPAQKQELANAAMEAASEAIVSPPRPEGK